MRHFDIQKPKLDSTRLMFKELESDNRTSKIDLGIGIYRDEKTLEPIRFDLVDIDLNQVQSNVKISLVHIH